MMEGKEHWSLVVRMRGSTGSKIACATRTITGTQIMLHTLQMYHPQRQSTSSFPKAPLFPPHYPCLRQSLNSIPQHGQPSLGKAGRMVQAKVNEYLHSYSKYFRAWIWNHLGWMCLHKQNCKGESNTGYWLGPVRKKNHPLYLKIKQ